MKMSYFLVYGFRPVECLDSDDINFIKFHFNTDNVIRLTYNQFTKINQLYKKYINNASDILNDKNIK